MRNRNRMRLLLAAALLVLAGVFGPAQVVAAQEGEEEHELDHEAEECIHTLEDGGSPEDCHEAPSPILPATNELIWGSISFVVLFFALTKFAWPGIKKGMEARTERIRADLEQAEGTKTEASTLLDEYKAQLADAKNEAARIIEESRQAADALRKDQEQRLQGELAEMRQRAAADVDAAKVQAIADLRAEVAQLALGAAEAVIGRSLDRSTQLQLVEDYINSVREQSLMVDERIVAYAEAMFNVAQGEGNLAEVEDELFRFARALEGSDELRRALTDQHLPVSRRQQIVEDLLGGKASPTTVALVSMAVGTGRSNSLPEIIDTLVQKSAEASQKAVAEVRSAIELDDEHRRKLADALERATGKKIEVKVIVDPSILGGLVATIGDTVIDGSVRTRLEQLKHSF